MATINVATIPPYSKDSPKDGRVGTKTSVTISFSLLKDLMSFIIIPYRAQ